MGDFTNALIGAYPPNSSGNVGHASDCHQQNSQQGVGNIPGFRSLPPGLDGHIVGNPERIPPSSKDGLGNPVPIPLPRKSKPSSVPP